MIPQAHLRDHAQKLVRVHIINDVRAAHASIKKRLGYVETVGDRRR